MIILGVTAMPKSGKSLFPEALKEQGWIHISMSGLLVKQFLHDEPTLKIDRDVMFNRVIKLREMWGADAVAAMTLDAIKELPPDSKVIVDGIRRPEEIKLLKASGNKVYLAGIVADEDPITDEAIRYKRWLKSMEERVGFDHITPEGFHATSLLEWHNPNNELGSQIGDCLAIIKGSSEGKIFENGRDKTKQQMMNEIRGYAHLIEGQPKIVER